MIEVMRDIAYGMPSITFDNGGSFPLAQGLPGIDFGETSRDIHLIGNDVYSRIPPSLQGVLSLVLAAQQRG